MRARRAVVGTETIYRCEKRWLPERLDIHHKVVGDLLPARPVQLRGSDRPVEADLTPHAVILLGMPGAGKTSQLLPIAREILRRMSSTMSVILDADAVRAALPEYASGRGSEIVQTETALITDRTLRDQAYRARANLIIDTVGHPKRSLKEARYLLRSGWNVWCLCARLDVRVAVDRVRRRALESGRYVPLSYVRSVGDRPIQAFENMTSGRVPLAGAALFDTGQAKLGPPRVLKSSDPELFGEPGLPTTLWPKATER